MKHQRQQRCAGLVRGGTDVSNSVHPRCGCWNYSTSGRANRRIGVNSAWGADQGLELIITPARNRDQGLGISISVRGGPPTGKQASRPWVTVVSLFFRGRTLSEPSSASSSSFVHLSA